MFFFQKENFQIFLERDTMIRLGDKWENNVHLKVKNFALRENEQNLIAVLRDIESYRKL